MKLKNIPMNKIKPNPTQPRETFSKEGIKELAESIKAQGLLQPIIVREKDGNFEIIAGERRWRAFSHLGKSEIPAIVWNIESDIEVAEKSLIENWEREDLTPIERENMITQIYESGRFSSAEELGKALGLSGQTVSKYIKVKKDRERLGVTTPAITTRDIEKTSGLDDETRKWMLKKMEKGDISKHEPEKIAKILKEVPEPIKKAIVKEEIDIEQVKPRAEVGIPKEMAEPLVEELKREKAEEESLKKYHEEVDKAILKGDLETKRVSIKRPEEEERLEKIKNLYRQVTALAPVHFEQIKYDKYRSEAIEYLKRMEKHCRDLLISLGEVELGGTYDVGGSTKN